MVSVLACGNKWIQVGTYTYVYDACNVLVKSYSKSILAATRGIVLVKSTTGFGLYAMAKIPCLNVS